MDRLYLVTQVGCEGCAKALDALSEHIADGSIIHKQCDDSPEGQKVCQVLDNLDIVDGVPSLILLREQDGEFSACDVNINTLQVENCQTPPVWFDE